MQFKYNQQQVKKSLRIHYCLSAGLEFSPSDKENPASVICGFQPLFDGYTALLY